MGTANDDLFSKPTHGAPTNIDEPSASRVFYKNYPRLPKIRLPASIPLNIQRHWAHRQSTRYFDSRPLPLSIISTLLQGAGINNPDRQPHRRTYPSGGGCYPLEIYLAAFSIEELPHGVYHFEVLSHRLEQLWLYDLSKKIPEINSPFVRNPAASIIITFTPSRSNHIYGKDAFNLALLEAGHIGQNILLAAAELEIGCCPIYGYDADTINSILDLSKSEHPIYVIALGHCK